MDNNVHVSGKDADYIVCKSDKIEEIITNMNDDLISRQKAIDALGEEPEVWFDDDNGDYDRGMRAQWRLDVYALKAIPPAELEVILFGSGIKYSGTSNLPSAEPERKTGKWYRPTGVMPPEQFGRHRCSECDGFAMHDWKHHKEQLTNFCPNCGARLEVEGIS